MKKLKDNYSEGQNTINEPFTYDTINDSMTLSQFVERMGYKPNNVVHAPIVKSIYNYQFFWFLRNRLLNISSLLSFNGEIDTVVELSAAIRKIDDIDFDDSSQIADFLDDYLQKKKEFEDQGINYHNDDILNNTLKLYSELN